MEDAEDLRPVGIGDILGFGALRRSRELLSGRAAGLLGSVVTAPFTAAVITVLFFDALVRKEGFSVNELALRMKETPQR